MEVTVKSDSKYVNKVVWTSPHSRIVTLITYPNGRVYLLVEDTSGDGGDVISCYVGRIDVDDSSDSSFDLFRAAVELAAKGKVIDDG